MVTHEKYANSPRRAYAGELNDDIGDSGTDIRVALMTDNFTIDRSADEVWGDVNDDEIDEDANDGYSAGGQTITGRSLTEDSLEVLFTGDDVVWENSTITAYYAVVYNNEPASASEKDLLSVIDFEQEESSDDGDFRIEWAEDAIFEADTT